MGLLLAFELVMFGLPRSDEGKLLLIPSGELSLALPESISNQAGSISSTSLSSSEDASLILLVWDLVPRKFLMRSIVSEMVLMTKERRCGVDHNSERTLSCPFSRSEKD